MKCKGCQQDHDPLLTCKRAALMKENKEPKPERKDTEARRLYMREYMKKYREKKVKMGDANEQKESA